MDGNSYVPYEQSTGNINYQWWCLKCQGYHGTPYCPWDELAEGFNSDKTFKFSYEYCPHCGQLIYHDYRGGL